MATVETTSERWREESLFVRDADEAGAEQEPREIAVREAQRQTMLERQGDEVRRPSHNVGSPRNHEEEKKSRLSAQAHGQVVAERCCR